MILSLHDEDWFITKLIRAGVMGYMSKAVSIPELIEAIKIVVLEDGMYFPDSVHPNMARLIENSDVEPISPNLPSFSQVELKVIEYLCKAFSNKEIAVLLRISKRTIDTHCVRIMDKMQVKNRSGLISYAYKMKIVAI
jgi:two-component system response regulator NreC